MNHVMKTVIKKSRLSFNLIKVPKLTFEYHQCSLRFKEVQPNLSFITFLLFRFLIQNQQSNRTSNNHSTCQTNKYFPQKNHKMIRYEKKQIPQTFLSLPFQPFSFFFHSTAKKRKNFIC